MESPHRSRFVVSVDEEFIKTKFVPVITCSEDVPRMHLLAELPPLGSVAAGAIAGLFTRKLELCCLQVLQAVALISHSDPTAACRLCKGLPLLLCSLTSPCKRTRTPHLSCVGRRSGRFCMKFTSTSIPCLCSRRCRPSFCSSCSSWFRQTPQSPIATRVSVLCNAAAAVQHPASAARHSTRAAHSRGRWRRTAPRNRFVR
jgi:hypothetical protein